MHITRLYSAALAMCALLACAGPASAIAPAVSAPAAVHSTGFLPVQWRPDRSEFRREIREREIRREVHQEHRIRRERDMRLEMMRRDRGMHHGRAHMGFPDRRW